MKELLEAVGRSVATLSGLRSLVLHGSRVQPKPGKDPSVEFAYLTEIGFDESQLRGRLSLFFASGVFEVTSPDRLGGLLRFRIARDGIAVFERTSEAFQDFQLEAAAFWLDIRHVVLAERPDAMTALD